MHSEYYEMSKETADILNKTRTNGKKVISVGTTCTRTLETIAHEYKNFTACFGNTKIFIYPGYEFKAVDVQITNFHLPKSTLLMLVSAFSTKKIILKAYQEAIKERYRFFLLEMLC
jgi:S-adenosylmethionine:tRNA ribosyltransferase-isomerase